MAEISRLTGRPVETLVQRRAAAETLLARGPAVLIKGGHGSGHHLVDLLLSADGERRFTHRRLETSSTHGTGCTQSSAIAARLARGEGMEVAVEGAIEYLHGASGAAHPLGSGHGPVDHLYRWK